MPFLSVHELKAAHADVLDDEEVHAREEFQHSHALSSPLQPRLLLPPTTPAPLARGLKQILSILRHRPHPTSPKVTRHFQAEWGASLAIQG